MTHYVFIGWQDGPTIPTRTITVNSDITLVALYNIVVRNVVVNTTPIAVQVTIGGVPVPSGQPVQVDDGATIVIAVPTDVTVQ